MDNSILKGNYKIEKELTVEKDSENLSDDVNSRIKKNILATLGGSMVYVEREKLVWDGDE